MSEVETEVNKKWPLSNKGIHKKLNTALINSVCTSNAITGKYTFKG